MKIDYYEFLQISPHAEQDTIHRVYRFLAGRFHPDNPQSGNVEMFSTLAAAYEVLSDPVRRAAYDLEWARETTRKIPMSNSVDFMDGVDGETNRRLAVLAVLYFRRRTTPAHPEVSLYEIEARMGFPRDYLDFTAWYLQKKGYVTRADNSDFTLTVQGVDYVETQRMRIPILNQLLTNGGEPTVANPTTAAETAHALSNPILVMPGVALLEERRIASRDRRTNAHDRRGVNSDRRAHARLAAGD